MAEVGAHELRGEVEVALACAVDEVAAFGVGDVHGVPVLLESPCAVVVLAREVDDLLARESLLLRFGGVGGAHDGDPIRSCSGLSRRWAGGWGVSLHEDEVGGGGDEEAYEPGVVVEESEGWNDEADEGDDDADCKRDDGSRVDAAGVFVGAVAVIERDDVEAGAANEEVVRDHDAGDGTEETGVADEPSEYVTAKGTH